MSNTTVMSPAEIQALIDKNALEIKKLKSQLKTAKVLKGVPVEFTTKDGTLIRGMGQRYYVVNLNGKLYYKQEDSVTLLESL